MAKSKKSVHTSSSNFKSAAISSDSIFAHTALNIIWILNLTCFFFLISLLSFKEQGEKPSSEASVNQG